MTKLFYAIYTSIAIGLLVTVQPIEATTFLWQGTNVSEDMKVATNWTPNGIPSSGDQAQFDSSTTGLNPTLSSGLTLDLMTFTNVGTPAAYTFMITGGNTSLIFAGSSLSPAGVNVLSGVKQEFFANQFSTIRFQDNTSADVGNTGLTEYVIGGGVGGTIIFEGNSSAGASEIDLINGIMNFTGTSNGTIGTFVTMDNGSVLNTDHSITLGTIGALAGTQINIAGTLTTGASGQLNALITDNGSPGTLTKVGTGTLNIGSNNTYTGGTNVQGGTILFNNVLPPPTGNVAVSSGANVDLELNTGTETYANPITGAGNLLINQTGGNTGTIVLTGFSGTNALTGDINIGGGTLRIDNQASAILPSDIIIASGAILDLEQVPTTIGNYTGQITGGGNLLVNQQSNRTGTVILSGLQGTGNYTGTTSVGNGTLIFNMTSLTPTTLTGGISIASPATVDFEQAAGTTTTYSGAITGAGKVLVNQNVGNTGTVVFDLPQYTGATTVSGGMLQVNSAPLTSSFTLQNNSILNFNTTGTYAGNIVGNGNLIVSAGAGSFTLSGLSGNVYTGTTLVNSGTLVFKNSSLSTTVAGNIILNGNVDFEQAPLTVGFYNGNISGAGGVTVNGQPGDTGLVVLSGTNTYTGGTTVSGGTLQGNTSSLQGIIINNATLNFNQTTDGTFNGTLAGPSTAVINKIGTRSLRINSNQSTFLGTTNVLQGDLDLTTTGILGGNVIVQGTGILSGGGTILGNLTLNSGGNVIPDVFHPLTVGGNYVQNAGSTYQVVVADNLSSQIDVNGIAILNPGSAVNVNPFGKAKINQPYTILTANGGLFGTFTTVTSSNPFYIPSVVYDPNHAFLFLAFQFAALAKTFNQRAVARQLESIINPTPFEEEILQELASLPLIEARRALDQMSAQQYTNLLLTAEVADRKFIRRLFAPIRSILVSKPVCAPPPPPIDCCDVCEGGGGPVPEAPPIPIFVWGELSGGKTFFHGNHNTHGIRISDYELTIGVQSSFPGIFTIGTAASYEVDHVSYRIGGSGKSKFGLGAVYAVLRPEGCYVFADFVFGRRRQTVNRPIDIGTIHLRACSSPKISNGTLYVEAGIDCMLNCMLIQPFVGFEAGCYRFATINEKGGDPLGVQVFNQSRTLAYSLFGFHFTSMAIPSGLTLGFDIAWQYRINNQGNNIRERFRDFGSSFKIRGFHLQRNSAEAAVRLIQGFGRGWEFFAEMWGQYWQSAFSYTFIGGVKTSW